MSDPFTPRCVYVGIDDVALVIPQLQELGLGAEVIFNNARPLWPQIKWEILLGLADDFHEAGLSASVHAPFYNLGLASRDDHIAEYTYQTHAASIEVARALGSPLVVFHTGFLPQYPHTMRGKWLDKFTAKLSSLLEVASENGVLLAMENTYEPDTSLFQEIFERVQHPYLGVCLDTGHATCFSKTPATEWVNAFAEQIVHVHLSDNDGKEDLHWSLGKGIVDFRGILSPLLDRGARQSVTFEVALADAGASRDHLNKLLDTFKPHETP
ncbi:sugar phosphate isomerase/epimerase [bacterium]|nr:sugar phosphate isomerase/epimerase [bacterium]